MPNIPQHILDLVDAHQHDLQKCALAAPPDTVLVTAYTKDNFMVHFSSRDEVMALLGPGAPEALKQPPEPVEGAIACCWVMVFEGSEAHWFSMSFFPEAQA